MAGVAVRADARTQSSGAVQDRFATNALFQPLREFGYDGLEAWAWDNYKPTILAFASQACLRRGKPARLIEIGGGRDPLFTPEEALSKGIAVTVNDIDANELAQAPQAFQRAQFDVAGDLERQGAVTGVYDLIVSRMVLEHVVDVPRAWANMRALLAPGGVALAFVPTLYAPPFLINKSIPEAVSARLLRTFFPRRHAGIQPKFPARYEWCFGDQRKLEPMLAAAGFSQTLVLPFWTHGYFRRLPLLREMDSAVQHLARARDWRGLTTYAYVLVRK
ncbi:MAG: methyltransferase domain-containing protein [Methylobacteriaceae bacterium]|nr:methyltransferase domain-containing protein [Methylobacteriaceae bacterium]MBV9703409.1 methyltransferase domain-containing protein [Methylobacteriaceae bacterium]